MTKLQPKILTALLCAVLLSSCSKKEESASSDYESPELAAQSADVAAVESATEVDNEPNTTPQAEQKPDVIINTQVNAAESARKMVREANVNFTSKDVVKTALAIDKMTYEVGGFVEQKDIDFRVVDSKSTKIADGKIKVFEKVDPVALMTVRVPSEKAAVYVNQLLPLMYFLNEQQYSAKRYELKLLEEKIQQTQVVPSDTKNSQLSEISKLTQMEVQDRVRYSTIKILMNQPSAVRERFEVDIDAVARLNGDGFWKRAWSGVVHGWQFVLDFLVVLITIWPLYFIFIIGFVIYRLLKQILNKLK
jgi:hypothetical protein